MKVFYFHLQTTGPDPDKNGIHQLAFIIEIDGAVHKKASINIQPFPTDQISDSTLKVSGKTREQIFHESNYKPEVAYTKLIKTLNLFIKPTDKNDKFFLSGYNTQLFDSQFLKRFFEKNGDNYFGSYFWTTNLDVMILAAQKLIKERSQMPDFKLATVAEAVGIPVAETFLHDAMYDLQLTRLVHKIVTA